MRHPEFPYQLYLVTDEVACLGRDFFWVLEEALKGGVDLIQLREKNMDQKAFIDKAKRTMETCSKYDVPLIINDDVMVTKAIGAFGLHLGQKDENIVAAQNYLGQDYPIGLSLEDPEQLYEKNAYKSWYFGVSPIYPTPTKKDTINSWGIEGLRKLRLMTEKPLVAIGGVKLSNACQLIEAGADCLAVVSGICSSKQPGKAAEKYLTEINKAKP